jgi:hypothetical protein
MMTEQRRKNDIGPLLPKMDVAIIRMHPFRHSVLPFFPGYSYAMRIIIDTHYPQPDVPAPAIPAQHPEIISSSAADLTYRHLLPVPYQLLQPAQADGMTPEPGIDKIQFPHISFDIFKRNIGTVEQFFLIAPF